MRTLTHSTFASAPHATPYGRAYGAAIVGAGAGAGAGVDPYGALATLRTFRGKLDAAVETTGAPEQMNLVIDTKPPEGGEIGGTGLAITPDNLGAVILALACGGEYPIIIEPVLPAEWRSETEVARSTETVGQLLPRVSRGIDRILAHVYSRDGRDGRVARGRGRGYGQARVGASILQTPGSIVDEIRSIGGQVRAFNAELEAFLRGHGYVVPASLGVQRLQLATLKKIEARDYLGAEVPGAVWQAGQVAALRAGGFPEPAVHELLGDEAKRKAWIAMLESQVHGFEASSVALAPPALRPLVDFYHGAWSAFFDNWKWWEQAHASWGDNFWWNHAPEAEKLLAQLAALRDTARRLGMPVYSPEPYNPEVGLYRGSGLGDVGDKVGDKLGDLWSILKWALIAALGIGGVVLLLFAFKGRSVRSLYR